MFHKHNPEIGARPGTLSIPETSPPPKIAVVRYGADSLERRVIDDVEELARIDQSDGITWVDIQGFGDEAKIHRIGEVFELHPFVLEAAVNVPQRAKMDVFEDQLVIIVRAPDVDAEGNVHTPQVCFVLGSRYLLTFQERHLGFFDPVRERMKNRHGRIRQGGADFLAYALIDAMVDRYYPVAQEIMDGLEELEEAVIENPDPELLGRIHMFRRQLVVLRRIGWPQREAISAILRTQTGFFSDQAKEYLRDTYDHIAQIVELVDSAREMASDLASTYLANVSHRTNEIMKVLTLMASIFIPLTFVAGIYGMNFEHMPELHSRNGYFIVLGVMAVLAIGMTLFFRRRGWLGGSSPPQARRRDGGDRSD